MKDYFDLVGRILLGGFFMVEGAEYLLDFPQKKLLMAEYHITWAQNFWLYGAIFLLVLGSLMVVLGYRIRFGAILLLLYWLPYVFVTDRFWGPEGIDHEALRLFMAHLAIAGGLFLAAVHRSGRFAVKKLFASSRVR